MRFTRVDTHVALDIPTEANPDRARLLLEKAEARGYRGIGRTWSYAVCNLWLGAASGILLLQPWRIARFNGMPYSLLVRTSDLYRRH